MGVEGTASAAEVIAAVEAAGYGAKERSTGKVNASSTAGAEDAEELLKDRETPVLKRRLIASVGFLVALTEVV
jgi:Cu2+-exporting ATPase